jgi:hypothetical protein
LTGLELATWCSPVKREARDWIEHVWNMRDRLSSVLKEVAFDDEAKSSHRAAPWP